MCSLILCTSLAQAQNNPDFFVENGTCKCPDADFGDTGTVSINGEEKTFTKRTKAELENLIDNNDQDPEIALTCTSAITNMEGLFFGQSSFNQYINNWDVSNITSMAFMFYAASDFDQPLENWDTSNVTNMLAMFLGARNFNQSINSWDVSNVEDMNELFFGADQFNQPLNDWDVSNVEKMVTMFRGADAFNQPLNDWNVNNIKSMQRMFENAYQFDQDLSSWVFNSEVDFDNLISYSGISQDNYELLLQSFNDQNLTDKFFTANLVGYCNNLDRNELISQKNWNISGDVKAQCDEPDFEPSTTAFVTTWSVTPDDLKVDILTSEFYEYDFMVDWGDGAIQTNLTSDVSHTYQFSGTYTVSITGVFPFFNLCKNIDSNACENASKLITIQAWGNQKWRNMHSSFRNADIMSLVANDVPDLSNVKQMNYMLSNCETISSAINDWNVTNVTEMSNLFSDIFSFNSELDSWDVSSVEYMEGMFDNCRNFNQPLNTWDVSNVKNMKSMFSFCENFNQPLNTWDVSNVKNMRSMFSSCENFNQPLNTWDVSSVNNMRAMFFRAFSFNQPLDNWDVSNVEEMEDMFLVTVAFNQPLDNWDVSGVINMNRMFRNASSFNQDISMWCVEQIANEPIDFSLDSPLLEENKPNWGVDCNLSTDDFTLFNVVVYPNPASDYFYISSANQNVIENLQLIDTNGKKYTINYSENSNRFDISAISSGLYFVQISYADGSSMVKKLIIK